MVGQALSKPPRQVGQALGVADPGRGHPDARGSEKHALLGGELFGGRWDPPTMLGQAPLYTLT